MKLFQIRGIKEVKANFKKKLKDTKQALRKSLKEAGNLIAADVRSRAPVGKQGNVKKGIVVRAGRRKKGQISVDVRLAPKAWYGRLIETGWIHAKSGKHIPGRPFFRPAYDADKEKAAQIIIDSVKAQIAKK